MPGLAAERGNHPPLLVPVDWQAIEQVLDGELGRPSALEDHRYEIRRKKARPNDSVARSIPGWLSE